MSDPSLVSRSLGRGSARTELHFFLISLGALFGGSVAAASSAPIAVAVGASIVMLAVLSVAATQDEIRNLKGA